MQLQLQAAGQQQTSQAATQATSWAHCSHHLLLLVPLVLVRPHTITATIVSSTSSTCRQV